MKCRACNKSISSGTRCAECLAKNRAGTRARRQRRKERKLCKECGKKVYKGSKTYCKQHHKKRLEYLARRRAKKRVTCKICDACTDHLTWQCPAGILLQQQSSGCVSCGSPGHRFDGNRIPCV